MTTPTTRGHRIPDGPMVPTPDVDLAERALRHFGESELTREHAARLLGMWAGRWMLDDRQVEQVLARFPLWSKQMLAAAGVSEPEPADDGGRAAYERELARLRGGVR